MLEVNRLKRAYGEVVAVDSVSFSIANNGIVGLLGHNGAGKTTVMKMLSGYLEPSAGTIYFDGLSLADNTKALQQKIGYLPESLPVYPEMSVAEYLEYAAELKGLRDAQKAAEVKRVILATDIASKLLAPIATLSRGYKQRVGVAQALLGKPSLLILDEPTNGLDPTQTLQMRELIRSIAKEATIILSTHIMQEVEALCDRVLMMRAGKLVIDATLSQLRQSQGIVLHTNLSSHEMEQYLDAIDGIQAITALGAGQWRLQLMEGADARLLSATLAKTLVAQGAELYQLQAERRDLESLFRDVNEGRGLDLVQEAMEHAA
ncbi:ABC transporter ATP-binding protein [Cellvibrio japonicus]|uniref:ABC transporter domain protein n=1 Tax=Cellvibrio japonicus (strain Ueda107) TaxID=498211 RepID=B3PBN0_CELJU|nr:ATP-binding cassette domain-containing protein [Cellvibrio japonicus]ACE85033.1 ABC transporter domain protein [Cellvibrio japonicus Ueda107]QEI11704.1 ATP-binding cassette domain-containing protein [Cellvibrio japonicus]QEI15278.1 ATP-binding cassette domain-containing protein [Cellvibrio japonicus]QEI18858.1 ATP-binding cassette domain-containing protein [Cellvibrio japonicus]